MIFVYDEFDDNAMVTFVMATMTMSHYYSDIGTIEVDAYINTRHAQVDSIQTINSDGIAALMRVQRHRTAIAIAAKAWSAPAASNLWP